MRHVTTATLALATACLLALTGCSSSSGAKPAATPPVTASAAAYNPAAWKTRVYTLIKTRLDPAQAECTASPSSDACANALKSADETILAMNQTITNAGVADGYPATVDHIRRNILTGYNKYIADSCEGNALADEYNSDCRGDMLLVLLGVATLPSKMTVDGN